MLPIQFVVRIANIVGEVDQVIPNLLGDEVRDRRVVAVEQSECRRGEPDALPSKVVFCEMLAVFFCSHRFVPSKVNTKCHGVISGSPGQCLRCRRPARTFDAADVVNEPSLIAHETRPQSGQIMEMAPDWKRCTRVAAR